MLAISVLWRMMTAHCRKKRSVFWLVFVYVAALLFSVSVLASVVISSMGLGGGVVAMVYPIHVPMASIATNATVTGVAMSQKRASADAPKLSHE